MGKACLRDDPLKVLKTSTELFQFPGGPPCDTIAPTKPFKGCGTHWGRVESKVISRQGVAKT